jgi:uncharacterized protein
MADWRVLAWTGPDPDRIEAAQVLLEGDTLRARGTTTTAEYTREWTLDCGPRRVTRRLWIAVHGDGWSRTLDLARDGDGDHGDGGARWTALRAEGDGAPHELDLGPLDLGGALDCDLALCPITNTMPVLRHDLVAAAQAGEPRSVDFVMAWVDVPDLTIHRSPQTYTVLGPAADGGGLIGFVSEDFRADITLDADGLVVDYPTIGTRIVP